MHKTANRIGSLKYIFYIYTFAVIFFAFLLSMPFANISDVSLMDALFISASAISVTGLTPLNIAEELTGWGQLLLMVEFQMGGIGIMAIYTYVVYFMGKDLSISNLLVMSADQNQKSIKSIQKFMLFIVTLTVMVELVGFLFAYPAVAKVYGHGLDSVFKAAFHAVSSFTNAGFDLFGDSLLSFQEHKFFLLSSTVLIILGVIGFPVILDLLNFKKKKKTLFTKVNLSVHSFLLVVGFLLFLLSEWSGAFSKLSFGDKITNAIFLSATSRNAGLSSVDIGSVQSVTLLVLLFLMFVGASSSSCGGGIRTSTFAVLVSKLWSVARGKEEASLFNKTIPDETVQKSFLIFFAFLFFYFVSLIVIGFVEPYSIRDLSFEVLSALTTTGLSTGITPLLSDFSKLLLSVLMLIGRIGTITWIYLFIKEKHTKTKYIKEDIIVG